MLKRKIEHKMSSLVYFWNIVLFFSGLFFVFLKY